MIITPKATFMHLPKTAGCTIARMLRDAGLVLRHDMHRSIVCAPTDRPIFGFERDPHSWYVSWWHFFTELSRGHPLMKALGDEAEDFDATVRRLLNPDANLIRNYIEAALPAQFGYCFPEIVTHWRVGEPYYHFLRRVYFEGATRVGRFERLRDDFKEMLTGVGLLDDRIAHLIDTLPPQNTSPYSVDVEYAGYYSDELWALVAEAELTYI